MKNKMTLAEARPDLIEQWDFEKNSPLTPDDVVPKSEKSVWWRFSYDDPVTGKHFVFSWKAVIRSRFEGCGCPYLTGRAVWKGFNDLATIKPELAAQWDYEKNGDLKPEDVTAQSNKKAWWIYHYDDPVTGKHFDFSWEALISDRFSGKGCPYLSGKAIYPGFNDLASIRPDLVKEWDYQKNGILKPTDISAKSGKFVWWIKHYDDPTTGKCFDFSWKAKIIDRTNGEGCPYLSGKAIWKGFNDLETLRPDLAKEWDYERNGSLTPSDITTGSGKIVWWKLPYDDPISGKHFVFSWKSNITNRCHGNECPYLVNRGVWPGFNDLATKRPDLAAQWNHEKNGDLKPTDVSPNSNKDVWWLLPFDDPDTGKHFDFIWKAKIRDRSRGTGCPYLIGKSVWLGYNDLATKRPDIAAQWDPEKNINLRPTDVTIKSNKLVWWILHYDDLGTGKHFDFSWKETVVNRVKGIGCPYLTNKIVWPGYNDLVTKRPDLAKEYDSKRNLLPADQVIYTSCSNYFWVCSHGHHWKTSPYNRIIYASMCPECLKLIKKGKMKPPYERKYEHPDDE